MRFRVLGRLRVEPQTPSAAKMCAVLGTLLISAGDVVSSDSLIDELWGDDPPRTATTTLHVYISHLRKLLAAPAGDEPRVTIETALPGYVIRAGDGDLDLFRFEALCEQGNEAYGRRDFAGADRLLREALGLWTGPLLAGVPRGRRLEAAADRLELLRLDAGEQRIASELWLGRYRELIGELTVLAREHPLRETLHAHLVVALYRANRQSEALAAFDTIRRSLAEELGADPGAALRSLHQRVLRAEPIRHFDECLRPRERAELRTTREPVVRMPRTEGPLTGREEELRGAERLLRAETRVLNVTGPAGAGKTAFAVELAQRVADLGPDGRVFVQLRGANGRPLETRSALARTLRLLREGPGTPVPAAGAGEDELGDLLGVALSGRRMLLVLDDPGSDGVVRALLAAAPEAVVVIASRRAVTCRPAATTLPLAPLRPADAVRLLASAAGRAGDDPAALAAVALACGHLPLALRAAGDVLRARPHWSARKLAVRLEEDARLAVLTLGDPDVRGRLRAGYLDLDEEARHAFRLLTAAPGVDFAPWCAAALLDCDRDRAEAVLDRLAAVRLLTVRRPPHGGARYAYDSLFRAVAAELAAEDPPPDAHAAQERLGETYLALARLARDRVTGGRDTASHESAEAAPEGAEQALGDSALTWFQQECAALSDVVRRAHADRRWEVVWSLAEAVTGYFEIAGEWERWEVAAHLALDAARRADDGGAQARVLCGQAALAWQRGQFALARSRYELARRRARETGDERTEARALIGVADSEWGSGRLIEARRFHGQAALLCRTGGDPYGLSDALRGLALTELRSGDLHAAAREFAECRDVAHRAGDRRWSEYARRMAADLREALDSPDPHDPFDGEALEVRPGVWSLRGAAGIAGAALGG